MAKEVEVGGSGGGSGMMVATASGGSSHISRGSFESNPQGYFSGLHGSGKSSKQNYCD
ncbi:hypothetical protein SLEP1_g50297 [Rubroshorea leprosula]|uniref:Uncharacterized protein n=1 Tax=Rubroshorea leprosula TaxID=152421 RepID=A0AAV5LZJ1_9ROSI|nr:hypothetical protein SLEP1_g50297 [Rubroshorea leprosula]